MKRITSLFLLTMSMGGTIFADQVDVQTAQTVAKNFMITRGVAKDSDVQLTSTYKAIDGTQSSMYVFSVNNGNGFVIVSGDDAIKPVLGYSTKNIFPANVTNAEVAYWMNGYNEQISYAIKNKLVAIPEVAEEWTSLKGNTPSHTGAKPTGVAPLLTTTWDQMIGSGNAYYNNLCPTGTPTGCVATAMAQIMYYHKFPAKGTGTHTYNTSAVGGPQSADFGAATYDWNNMPLTLNGGSTTAQKNAIALIMYHCGVSVDMSYNTPINDGSGAYVNSNPQIGIPNCSFYAYTTYFGYSNDIAALNKSDFTDATWISKLKAEIDASRPILYTGQAAVGGHAFVFDGYDDDNKFDVNWGWSGASNGYFVIGSLNPPALGVGAGDGNFNLNQGALIKIHPGTTAINEVLDADLLNVYPNPAKDMLYIDLSKFDGKVTAANLFNIQGQKVSAVENLNGSKLSLNTNQLASGFYFLHVQSDKGLINKKITVQH
jgi:hypothetical protein